MGHPSMLCFTLMVLAWASNSVDAFPGNFLTRHNPASCNTHPLRALGPHSPPAEDSTIRITLDPIGPPSNDAGPSNHDGDAICPGRQYILKVSFADPRLGLLTVNTGTDADIVCSNDTSSRSCCTDASGTRWLLTAEYEMAQPSYNVSLQIPCGVKEALQVKVTSARGSSSNFFHYAKTFQPGQNCGACVNRSPPPPPPRLVPRKVIQNPPPRSQPPKSPAVMSGLSPSVDKSPVPVPTACSKANVSSDTALSSLGYTDSHDSGVVVLHWSRGSCTPQNLCTDIAGRSNYSVGATGSSNTTLLHFAAEASTTGYASVGFAPAVNRMEGTHAVVGYVDDATGKGVVQVYKLEARTLGRQLGPHGSTINVLYSGVVQTSDKKTILCFAGSLDDAVGTVESFPQLVQGESLAVNWAVGDSDSLVHHTQAGGMKVELSMAQAEAPAQAQTAGVAKRHNHHAPEGRLTKRVYEALMIFAWFLVHPLAIIAARQRWMFGEKDVVGVELWLLVHQLLHAAGISLQIGALILLWTNAGTGCCSGRGIFEAHLVTGTAAMVLAALQCMGAIFKARLPEICRRGWKQLHRGTGVLIVLLGAVTCLLGAILIHDIYHDSLWWWITLCIAATAALFTLDYLLTVGGRHARSAKKAVSAAELPDLSPTTGQQLPPAVAEAPEPAVNPLWILDSNTETVNPLWSVDSNTPAVNRPLWSVDSNTSDVERPILASKIARGLKASVL